MILKKLAAVANKNTNEISMFSTILQKFAYKMYIEKIEDYVDESYIIGVILNYKENHSNAKLKTLDVLKKLVDYNLLENQNDKYRFKNSYMFYYFVGCYFEERLSPNDKLQTIRDVFCNINQETNYNIALFLAYRMNIEYKIIPLIKEVGDSLLNEFIDFNYDDIKILIEKWRGSIEEKVARIYNVPQNEEISKIRQKRMAELEESEAVTEEVTEEDSSTNQLVQILNNDVIKLARCIDFVSNLLKNYSGKMENDLREESIEFLFKSVSKIIGSLCNFSMYMVDNIIRMIEEKIKEGNDEELRAKNDFTEAIKGIFAKIIFMFIEGNLMGLAASMDCDILKENLDSFCSSHNTEFAKMVRVEYLIRISSTKLPVDEITSLFKGKDSLCDISQKILKNNIYKYLISYQYDMQDRQSVCSILGFNSRELLIQEQKTVMLAEK